MSNRNRDVDDKSRREIRRHRRRKSQAIAYITLVILIIIAIIAGFFGVEKLSDRIEKFKTAHTSVSVASSAEAVTIAEPADEGTSTQSEEEMLDEIVQSCISEMPIEDKVAGLFMVSPEQLTGVNTVIQAGDGTQKALTEYAVGGLCYSDKNIKDADQITTMISTTSSMSKYPMFFAISETGGDNSPIANALGLEKVDSEKEIGDSSDIGQATVAGQKIAEYMNQYGFNFDIAPNANIAVADGDDSDLYSSDATVVSDNSSAMVQALQDNGITACMKYFPVSSSATGASSDATLEDIRNTGFIPFMGGISAGTKAIMVGSTINSNVTGDDTPFCLSGVIVNDILRNEMGFDGIIVTDALDSGAVAEKYTPDQAAVAAITAGADIIYMPADFKTAYDGLLAAVQNGTITEDRINESLTRIYRVKYENKVSDITASSSTQASGASSADSQADGLDSAEASSEGSDAITDSATAGSAK